MGVVDWEKLPTGNRGWVEFIAALEAGDDRVERDCLEMKSGFDLSEKGDLRKVVKFILGAAHRDPARAARHFDGHALMVLGLPLDGVRGVAKFEVRDLEREVKNFVGEDAPGWDIQLVPAGDGRDVVVIIVDPPTGGIWPVLKDGAPLASGDVYIRVEGETRKAKGAELAAMFRRLQQPTRTLGVTVEPRGVIHAFVIDSEDLRSLVERYVDELEGQLEADEKRLASPWNVARMREDRRDPDRFLKAVEAWRREAREDPASGVLNLASQFSESFAVDVVNTTTMSLREVRLELAFDPPVRALHWAPRKGKVRLFPDRPADWGAEKILDFTTHVVPTAEARDGRLRIEAENPAMLVVEVGRLHAEQTVKTPDDEVVLVLVADDAEDFPKRVTARWRVMAGDVHEVLPGSFDIDVSARDWRGPLSTIISGIRSAE
ncbi:hypothetical protein [Microbacterium sp.]|uniref:hypothetical protein n=1 Tax=Microbacterium sp. TaxID=51671 RepID=UPI00289F6E81|nr:hypothetical protein [Microbacterium sp.]